MKMSGAQFPAHTLDGYGSGMPLEGVNARRWMP